MYLAHRLTPCLCDFAPDVQPRRSVVAGSLLAARMPRRAEEETSAPLSVGGVEDEQRFGRGIDLLFCLCLDGLALWAATRIFYFGLWWAVGLDCCVCVCVAYLLYNFLYGLDSDRGGHFYLLPGS
jgi:hypothetical protein